MSKYTFHHTFKYCPVCGSEFFLENNEKSKKCEICGFVYYFNASAAVAAFITNEKGELLVCRRKKEPAKGTLDLPGGFVDMNETAEQSIAREIKEELNIELKSLKYLFSLPNIYRYSDLDIHTLDMFFEAEIKDFSLMQADDDVAEVFFIEKEDINLDDFGLVSIKNAVRRYNPQPLKGSKTGQ